jgi:hypothetical protein
VTRIEDRAVGDVRQFDRIPWDRFFRVTPEPPRWHSREGVNDGWIITLRPINRALPTENHRVGMVGTSGTASRLALGVLEWENSKERNEDGERDGVPAEGCGRQ